MISSIWKLLHVGYELKDSVAWKNRTNAINLVVVVLVVIAQMINFDITEEDSIMLATGIVAVVNIVLSVMSSKDNGIPVASVPLKTPDVPLKTPDVPLKTPDVPLKTPDVKKNNHVVNSEGSSRSVKDRMNIG